MVNRRGKIHTISECAIFSALICVLSPFVIPAGPVPFSLSLLAVMFTGVVLPGKRAVCAVGVYILLGCVGVPVFSGFRGGINCLAGPTGGYIWSYMLVVVLVSESAKYGFVMRFVIFLLALVSIYFFGTIQYMLITGADSILSALVMCVFPFVFFDLVKVAVSIVLGDKIRKMLIKQNLLQ